MTPHRTVFTIADPTAPRQRPSDASAAIEIMNSGNAAYAGRGTEGTYEVTVDPEAFGVPRTPGTTIRQEPLAALKKPATLYPFGTKADTVTTLKNKNLKWKLCP